MLFLKAFIVNLAPKSQCAFNFSFLNKDEIKQLFLSNFFEQRHSSLPKRRTTHKIY